MAVPIDIISRALDRSRSGKPIADSGFRNRWGAHWSGWWTRARARSRDRQIIARMSEREIADLGTTRGQLEFDLEPAWKRRLGHL